MRRLVGISLVVASLLSVVPAAQPAAGSACARCGWRPPTTARTVTVHTVSELYRAVSEARSDTTILVADGEYRLDRQVDFSTPHVVLRGIHGLPDRVVLRGASMTEQEVGVGLSISASDITIADLTVGFVGFHGIQVRGERGASRLMVHNVRIVDTGQQLIKGSTDAGALHADEGTVACSTLEYSDHAPSDYTNGVDVLGGNDWTVRDNVFRRIRGPESVNYAAGPAVLFWANSQRTLIERNVVIDSSRGIALGLGPGASGQRARDAEPRYDHQEGWIRNNVVVNLNPWADEGIEANATRDVRIDHNTVLTEGLLSWSISLRFPTTTGYARNNLTTRSVLLRDGGTGVLVGNVSRAAMNWFIDAPAGDARLARPDTPAADAGVRIADLTEDMARRPRTAGKGPDAGAYER